jgi:phage-related protein
MAVEPQPFFGWCPQPGMSRATKLTVDTAAYGDGYIHRATRGLNPARPSWSYSIPFTSLAELTDLDDFLTLYAGRGFYVLPPDSNDYVLVTADDWSAQITDKNKDRGIVGVLTATFTRSFNPQPLSP